MKVAIIGGGLAGTACAYVLHQYGADCTIYEAGETLAAGASGNDLGLYNPRFSAHRTPEAQFYTGAFALALRAFKELDGIDWNPAGALHLITDEKKEKRFSQMLESWAWPEEDMRRVSAQGASEIAGIIVQHEAVYLPHSGSVSPARLCEAYSRTADIKLKTRVESPGDIQADAIILACGMGVLDFEETKWLPLSGVRGQITQAAANETTRRLKCNLCYGGYMTAAQSGTHMIGSTFQRWLDHDDVLPEDDADNIAKLSAITPELAENLQVNDSRAAIRTTAKDQFPVVGSVPGHKNLYVSTGHGSHGILSSLIAAHVLADIILDQPRSMPVSVLEKLKPARFGGPV